MTRRATVLVGTTAALALWLLSQTANQRPLDTLFPPSPLVYAEVRDFAALLRDWDTSAEKAAWLKSANHDEFSRSRLLLRLAELQQNYAAAAGLPVDMALAREVAGSESALAIYDIGNLEFLYITRLPSTRAIATALWKQRTAYESRKVAGQEFFVTRGRGMSAAFAAVGDYLLLATREDLLARALTNLAGTQGPSLASEPWYRQAADQAGAKGELRIALQMPPLLASPYFRSYWIQRNVSTLRQYAAGAIDVVRDAAGWTERRVFVRGEPAEPRAAVEGAVARVLAYVPPDANLHRAWAQPSVDDAARLARKLAPRARAVVQGAAQGRDNDLETFIDQPPVEAAGTLDEVAVREMLVRNRLDAMLDVQSSQALSDGVFVRLRSAVVLIGANNWNEAEVRAALPGVELRVRDRVLVAANDADWLGAVVARLDAAPTGDGAVYAAGFAHARELPNYEKLMRSLDAGENAAASQSPQLFSGNVASLGRILGRLQNVTIRVRDEGKLERHVVRYQMR